MTDKDLIAEQRRDFEKWFSRESSLDADIEDCFDSWQADKESDRKRIAELEKKLAEQQARKFKRLTDVQWVNIVNHPDVLKNGNYDAEDAVVEAFKLIE